MKRIFYIRKYIKTIQEIKNYTNFLNHDYQQNVYLKKRLELLNNISSFRLLKLKLIIIKEKQNLGIFL